MPVAEMPKVLDELAGVLRPEQIVVDVGSVKVMPERWMREILGQRVRWVASHPLFGPVSMARGERPLRVVVCPNPAHPDAVEAVRGLYASAGCNVAELTADAHDRLMAETHAVAFLIAKAILDAGLVTDSVLAPASYRAIQHVVEAVRADAGHLFVTIQHMNPHAKQARRALRDAISTLDERLDRESTLDAEADPALVIPDLGQQSPALLEARERIDEIDEEILALLARRTELSRMAKDAKASVGGGVFDPRREEALLEARRAAAARRALDPDATEEVFRAILRASRRAQR
jgi:prephenate dehydrogenase